MSQTHIEAIIVTPVKNSVERSLETIGAIHASIVPIGHYVYNDFSTPETKAKLNEQREHYGYTLIHLEDITDHPSPNYRLVLQDAQQKANAQGVPLIIVESDVIVQPDTFQQLLAFYRKQPQVGLIGAITVDEQGAINFPYLRFKDRPTDTIALKTKKSLSFCCTLISPEFLQAYDFSGLNDSKDWFDTFISYQATDMGFENYLLFRTPVLHRPHGSRPWKQLKYTNPLKYYLLKFIKRRDKI